MVGTVTISVEIELGWGYHDIDKDDRYGKLSERREQETEKLTQFLDLLDCHDIPVSFDVIGHLFLDQCTGTHQGKYPEGWFTEDPGTEVDQDPLFYAPDLITAIEDTDTDHEICTHTFSHFLCNEISKTGLKSELETVQQLHQENLGEKTVSLVTPRHQEVSKSLIQDFGINVLRVPTDDLPESRISRFFWYLFGSHPVEDVVEKQGVTETYTSPGMSLTAYHLPTGQTPPHPIFRIIPERFRRSLHERYLNDALDRACQQDSNIHLWTHLHDMTNESQWPAIKSFLGSLNTAVSDGDARIARMEDLAPDNGKNCDRP